MSEWCKQTTLSRGDILLDQLRPEHAKDILRAASDGELWRLWYTTVPSAETLDEYMRIALQQRDAGTSVPFVVRLQSTGEIIGTTRYCNIDDANRRLEIGYTFYGQSHQRSHVNTTCKYLLLQYAFEELDAIAVEFRTHWFNTRSRAAIARLGAKQDGILRNHRINDAGQIRDTVVFSIINVEWPTVKYALECKLQR